MIAEYEINYRCGILPSCDRLSIKRLFYALLLLGNSPSSQFESASENRVSRSSRGIGLWSAEERFTFSAVDISDTAAIVRARAKLPRETRMLVLPGR